MSASLRLRSTCVRRRERRSVPHPPRAYFYEIWYDERATIPLLHTVTRGPTQFADVLISAQGLEAPLPVLATGTTGPTPKSRDRIAIIGATRKNRIHHPSGEVLF
jgi:hypothetical protein